jgi:predicted nucleic acid-binding protein
MQIAFLDSSALVKRYIVERGSREAIALTADSEITATSIVSRAEVAAAFAKAVRAGLVKEESHGTPNEGSPEIGPTSHACPPQKHS